jgi:hypothetical protein
MTEEQDRMTNLAGQRTAGRTSAIVGGLAAVVVGTFLPWLRSGSALRNSFRAAGLINRLLQPPGAAGALLAVWPGVVFACAVAVAALVLGMRRVGTLIAALVAIAVGAVATTTLLLPARSFASVAMIGPAVCLAGAVLALAGAAAQARAVLGERRSTGRAR